MSEWMGYCLLFESMLDSVLWARERYLKPGGLVLPDHCTMTLVGLSNPDLHDRNVDYWDDVYGFKMSCMRTLVVREASVMVTDPSKLVTDECVFKVSLTKKMFYFLFSVVAVSKCSHMHTSRMGNIKDIKKRKYQVEIHTKRKRES